MKFATLLFLSVTVFIVGCQKESDDTIASDPNTVNNGVNNGDTMQMDTILVCRKISKSYTASLGGYTENYTYDSDDNLIEYTVSRDYGYDLEQTNYVYDSEGREIKFDYSDSDNKSGTYDLVYSSSGQIESISKDGLVVFSVEYDDQNNISKIDMIEYDKWNLSTPGVSKYFHNIFPIMGYILGGNLAGMYDDFDYNAEGRVFRVTNTTTGTIYQFQYNDDGQVIKLGTGTGNDPSSETQYYFTYSSDGKLLSSEEYPEASWLRHELKNFLHDSYGNPIYYDLYQKAKTSTTPSNLGYYEESYDCDEIIQ